VEGTAEVSRWARDFAGERWREWGRWRQRAPEGDPLHAGAKHWATPRSALISEPTSAGGLGMAPEAWLLNAGVVAVGHMCRTSTMPDGSLRHEWRREYEAARRANRRLPAHGAAAAAWERQLQRLVAAGVEPEQQECTVELQPTPIAAAMATHARRAAKTVQVDRAAAEEVLADLERSEVREARVKEDWKRELGRCFKGVVRQPASEWVHGCRDRGEEAEGARCVLALKETEAAPAWGGEARWLARGKRGRGMVQGDEDGIKVGDDGWAVGHQVEEEELSALYSVDEEGYVLGAEGRRLEGAELGAAPPAVQMAARARIEVGGLAPEAPVVDKWPPRKQKKTHVNVEVCRRNLRALIRWQARIRATGVYTLDGSRCTVGEGEDTEYVCARAAARHDGRLFGGRIKAPEGADNYLAELAAHLDALNEEGAGGRIIIIFDATSPVLARRAFQRCCHRRRQGYYVGEWLEAMMRLVARQEVVVFLWQTSHVGSAINEWADLLAGSAANDCVDLRSSEVCPFTEVPRFEPRSASMRLTAPGRSTHSWARGHAMRAVGSKLAGMLVETQVRYDTDMVPFRLPDEVQLVCDAVLSQRSVMGDERRHVGRVRLAVLGACMCPFGCVDEQGKQVRFTWLHAQMFCKEKKLVEARSAWVDALNVACEALTPAGTNLPHGQLRETIKLAEPFLAAAGGAPGPCRVRSHLEVSVRRCVGGCIRAPGDQGIERKSSARATVVKALIAGAKVQQVARALTRDREDEALKEAAATQRVRRFATGWLWTTREGGPARVAALRRVEEAAGAAAAEIVARAEKQVISADRAEELLDAMVTSGSPSEVLNHTAVGAVIALARIEYPRQRTGATGAGGLEGTSVWWQWKILALAKRWQLRAALRQRRWDGVEDPAWEESDGAEKQVIRVDTVHKSVGCELTQELLWAVSGDGTAPEHSVEQEAGLARRAGGANRVWLAAGGWKRERARRKEEAQAVARRAEAREQQRTARLGEMFMAYMAQGSGAAGAGISGDRLGERGGEKIILEISARKRTRQQSGRRATRPKAQSTSKFERGEEPNGRNMWRVERVMEVRRVEGRTRARGAARLQVKIRWVGSWRDTWSETHGVVEEEGRVRRVPLFNQALMAEARQMEKVKYGARAPKRAVDERVPLTGHKRWRKWTRALRSSANGEEEGEGEGVRRRVPKARRISMDQGDASVTGNKRTWEEALADLRRQRHAGFVNGGGAGRRRGGRRAVMVSEDDLSEAEGGTEEQLHVGD